MSFETCCLPGVVVGGQREPVETVPFLPDGGDDADEEHRDADEGRAGR